MTTNTQVRRATLDDLVLLRRLWQHAKLPVAELEKKFTEFQVVETPSGELLGAIALQIHEKHARIHSEVYQTSELAEELRPRFWDRIQAVARNQGLVWLWIGPDASMFWLETGFQAATAKEMQRLPAMLSEGCGSRWLILQIREENPGGISLEQELAVFKTTQQAESERVRRQAQFLRIFAAVVTVGAVFLLAMAAWYLLRHFHKTPRL